MRGADPWIWASIRYPDSWDFLESLLVAVRGVVGQRVVSCGQETLGPRVWLKHPGGVAEGYIHPLIVMSNRLDALADKVIRNQSAVVIAPLRFPLLICSINAKTSGQGYGVNCEGIKTSQMDNQQKILRLGHDRFEYFKSNNAFKWPMNLFQNRFRKNSRLYAIPRAPNLLCRPSSLDFWRLGLSLKFSP